MVRIKPDGSGTSSRRESDFLVVWQQNRRMATFLTQLEMRLIVIFFKEEPVMLNMAGYLQHFVAIPLTSRKAGRDNELYST